MTAARVRIEDAGAYVSDPTADDLHAEVFRGLYRPGEDRRREQAEVLEGNDFGAAAREYERVHGPSLPTWRQRHGD